MMKTDFLSSGSGDAGHTHYYSLLNYHFHFVGKIQRQLIS